MDGQDSAGPQSSADGSPPGDRSRGEERTIPRAEYEAVVGALEEAVFVFDVHRADGELAFEFRRNNAAHRRQTGVTTEEFLGRRPREILEGQAGAELTERFRDCVERGERVEYEESAEYPAGTVDWRTTLTPISENGGVTRLVGVAREGSDESRDIQELKQEYETVFQNAQDVFFLLTVDESGTIRFDRFNEHEEAVVGRSTREIQGKTPVEAFGEELGSQLEANYRECVEREETITYEEERQFGDTTSVWRTRLTPIVVDGRVERIVGSGHEITEFRDRERTLEQLVERMGDGIGATTSEAIGEVAVDIVGNALGAPLAGVHLLSEDGERLESVAAIDRVREEFDVPPSYDRDGTDAPSELVWEAFESGDPIRISDAREYGGLAEETPARSGIVHPLGNHGVLIVSTTEVDGFDETVQNYIELLSQMLTAVLDRHERERTVEEARARLQALFDASPDMINIHDEDGEVLDANRQFCEKLGYSIDEVVGKWIWDFDERADPGETRAALAEMEPGERLRVEGTYRCRDGSTFPAEIHVRRLGLADGSEFQVISRDISERRRRERELRELKERLELAVDGAEIGVWDWDLRTDEVEFNDQWAEMLGYSLDEIEADLDAWEKRVHPDDLEAVEEDLEAHMAGETAFYETEHRMRTADGGWKWIRDLGKIVERTEDGEPIRAVGIHLDIEERKQRERELEFQEMIVEESTDIAMSMDLDGKITFASPAVRRVLGYEPEELLGQDGLELQHPDDREAITDAIERLQDDPDSPQTVQVRFRQPEGGWCWLEMRMRNFVDDERIDGILVNSRNVTERKEYEKSLEQAREELRRIIDLVPDLIFVKNRDGEYLLANERTAELYGLTPEEVEGKKESDVIPAVEDSEEFREDDIAVIESGESTFIEEEELRTADGETRVLQTTKIPYEVPETGETAVLGYARDVTELKTYERTLENQRDNLEVLNQVVRHDIRNNLQIVSVYAEALLEHVSEDGEEYASKILEAARDAVEITESSQEVTKVMIQSDVDRSPVRLRSVLEGEIDDVRASHDKALVTVDGVIPRATVLADDMLESVFRNLLTNAIKHNDKPIAEVTVSATAADDEVVVRIADNGPGVPDGRKDEIFTEGEAGLETGGTGLGLYLVETLVERYRGDISVEDNEPTGAVFVVRLPTVE
jgi:PAS domain S-box-containing protein